MRTRDLRKYKKETIALHFARFYELSIFTWEGMNAEKENLETINKELGLKGKTAYIYSGKQMNDVYGLTGENAYPEDLTFISIEDFYNPMIKISVGARWFDDIVENNRTRQNEIDGKEEE